MINILLTAKLLNNKLNKKKCLNSIVKLTKEKYTV